MTEAEIDLALTTITPVQEFNGLYWKRDDHFRPFGPYHVNGGKVRQAFLVFRAMLDDLRGKKFANGVVTAASVHSPQSANIAAVGRHYGVRCISCVGGTTPDKLYTHHQMRLTRHYGSEIRIVAGHGMTAVIHARMHTIAQEMNYLPIEMGELMSVNPKAIFESTAEQVQNIPDDLDVLVIPAGVAIQTTGILIGLKRYQKHVKRIISVCVGPTREKQLQGYFQSIYHTHPSYYHEVEMVAHKAPYSKPFPYYVNGEALDDLYEGKAVDWLYKNVDTRKEKTLFWCVGKRSSVEDVQHIIDGML